MLQCDDAECNVHVTQTEPEVAWEQKYTQTSEGLPAERVSLYGWHLLEVTFDATCIPLLSQLVHVRA